MEWLILTTLPHYVAIVPIWNDPLLERYCYTISISTTLSILYHAYHESNMIIMWLDYMMALVWFLYDVSWGLMMTPYSFSLLLALNGLVFLANQSISYDDRYPARHSFWHLFSACKCICISVLISHTMHASKDLSPIYDNMAFVQAMNALKLGAKGADVYTEVGVGDDRVSLFTMLNRGLEADYIQQHVHTIHARNDTEWIRDLWVMAFQTRDIRGGKGERKLFYQFIESLYQVNPAETEKMLSLVPEYGCWRDLWEIWQRIPALEPAILELVRKTFVDDFNFMRLGSSAQNGRMSLLGKWLPREKSKTFPGLAKKIAQCLYRSEPSPNKQMMFYRSMCSELNRRLKTVEVNMCSKSWAQISPEAVPGRCLKIHDKAFLNEPTKKQASSNELRFPDNEDRMECRAHFQDFVEGLKAGTKKAHGANVVLPHELVVKTEDYTTSADQHAIIQAQWDGIREETVKGGGLGKSVAMCDFSGSMHGTPIEVSKALGVLISEITHPAFRDHILTFDAVPQWHSFVGKKTLKTKLASLRGCGQGLNTDFYKACQCIIERMVQNKVPVGEEPEDLIVITDMGFDAASTPRSSHTLPAWETQLVRIRCEFQEAGEKLWGTGCGWTPPRIVIWNVRAEYKDFHAKADEDGVVQLSGWAPSMLKALQTGVKVQTPYEGMRCILDDARYDAVRELCVL